MGDCKMEIKFESIFSFYFCFFQGRGYSRKYLVQGYYILLLFSECLWGEYMNVKKQLGWGSDIFLGVFLGVGLLVFLFRACVGY